MWRNLLFILAFLAKIALPFILMLGFGLSVLPYHATGTHANFKSDLFSLSELLIGLFLIIISVVVSHRNPRYKLTATICLGFGLGLIACVIIGNWPDINDTSR